MSALGPGCVKTRNFLDSGGASPLPYTEIVAYRRSSKDKFLDQNFIRSFYTAWARSGHKKTLPRRRGHQIFDETDMLFGKHSDVKDS